MGSFGTENGIVTESTGDFDDIADDTYNAEITAISAIFKDTYEGKESTKCTVEFLIIPREDQDVPENYTRMFWLTLTDLFLTRGFIHEKSHLRALMIALGYDMDKPVAFDSDEWLGRKVRVTIGHTKTGFPKITGFMAPLPSKRREPVAAGAASRPTRPAKGEEWDE